MHRETPARKGISATARIGDAISDYQRTVGRGTDVVPPVASCAHAQRTFIFKICANEHTTIQIIFHIRRLDPSTDKQALGLLLFSPSSPRGTLRVLTGADLLMILVSRPVVSLHTACHVHPGTASLHRVCNIFRCQPARHDQWEGAEPVSVSATALARSQSKDTPVPPACALPGTFVSRSTAIDGPDGMP